MMLYSVRRPGSISGAINIHHYSSVVNCILPVNGPPEYEGKNLSVDPKRSRGAMT